MTQNKTLTDEALQVATTRYEYEIFVALEQLLDRAIKKNDELQSQVNMLRSVLINALEGLAWADVHINSDLIKENIKRVQKALSATAPQSLIEHDNEVISKFEQSLTDDENQPSQFGTVPLSWYENLEKKIERIRFKVGEVIDSLDGSYERHSIRKQLQTAIDDK